MGCISIGRLKNCNTQAAAGLSRLWLADATEVDSFTTAGTAGAVDTITMVGTSVFYEFEFLADTGQLLEEGDNTNGIIVTQTINSVFKGKTQEDRNSVEEMYKCNCGLVAIVEDANGQKWFLGYIKNREVKLLSFSADTGTALGEQSQVALVLQAITTEPALLFEATVPV